MFLYIKKNNLNEQLYNKHLQCAALWRNCWPTFHGTTVDALKSEMDAHYEKLNKKLDKIVGKQKQPPHSVHKQQQNYFPHTINLTKIKFTNDEQALLDLGLQYNIQPPLKKRWTNIVLETEKAIILLEAREQKAFCILATKKLKYTTSTTTHTQHTQEKMIYIYTQKHQPQAHTRKCNDHPSR
jgi:hypothetical protein